jgi:hypothetical protein
MLPKRSIESMIVDLLEYYFEDVEEFDFLTNSERDILETKVNWERVKIWMDKERN